MPRIKKKKLDSGVRLTVRDSTRVEEALDVLLDEIMSFAPSDDWEEAEDKLKEIEDWRKDVVKLTEEVERLVALEQAGADCIRR